MIHETAIKEKDFEDALQRLIGQANFIALSLMHEENADSLDSDDIMGAGYMLKDIVEDLAVIKETMYPKDQDEGLLLLLTRLPEDRKKEALTCLESLLHQTEKKREG